MIKVAKENGALAAKLAGAGSAGTIIALSYEPERTKQALLDVGVECFAKLDPHAQVVTVEYLGEGYERVAVTRE